MMEGENRPPDGHESDRPRWEPPVPPGPPPSPPPPSWQPPAPPGEAPFPPAEAPQPPAQPPPGYPPPACYQPPPPVPYGGRQWPPGTWNGRDLGGWWQRVGAALLDGLIVGLPILVVIIAVDPLLGILLGLTATLTYYPLTMMREGQANGQTIGKQVAGVRVVQVSGEPFAYGAGVLREFAIKYLLFNVVGGFFLGVPSLLNYLWPLWDDENRALHDMLASTRVVQA